jgi:hypothetical protein
MSRTYPHGKMTQIKVIFFSWGKLFKGAGEEDLLKYEPYNNLTSSLYFKTEWVSWQWLDLAISGVSIPAAILLYGALLTVNV